MVGGQIAVVRVAKTLEIDGENRRSATPKRRTILPDREATRQHPSRKTSYVVRDLGDHTNRWVSNTSTVFHMFENKLGKMEADNKSTG